MAEFNPTAAQKSAIDTRGRAVLVSAAAGSGKTKVLTERLLARISEDADIDGFLIITFTKAAAAELKSRIMDEIASRLALDPENRRLRRQNALLQRAQIGTIHSFCSCVLRENCHAAGLSPEFRVIEEDRAEAIKERVLDKLMEQRYERMEDNFRLLADTVGSGRDDSRLTALVLNLHKKMQSHARCAAWAEKQAELISAEYSDAGESPWGREILSSLKCSADFWAECMESLSREAAGDAAIYKTYGASLEQTALSIRDFSRALKVGWDCAAERLPIDFPRLGSLRNSPNPELSERIKAVRDSCRTAVKRYSELLSSSSQKLISDLASTAGAMEALLALTLDFDRAYTAEKRRRAEVDFADLEHLTAELLTNEDGSATELARTLSLRYTEIMVDEYQDVNRVQDAIFRAVSKDGSNLFMVGDVKQSIYRFRLADPTLFTEKYMSYADIGQGSDTAPVRIMLQENFRSRREVINAANFVFKTEMSRRLGDIDYDENAELYCGAAYEGAVPQPELILLDTQGGDEDAPDKTELEAALVAEKIRRLIDAGTPVSDRGVTRPARWSDVAILMRSANAVGDTYRRELIKAGVPVAAGQGGAFFGSDEITGLMCLLAAVDNPHQDIALIAALRSAAFGFSADELSEIRAADKDADFFTALTLAAKESEKCASFLDKLSLFRSLAPDTELGELLWRIYDELDLMALCSAMSDGEARRENLMLMLEYAKRFESGGYRGLHRFNDWLRRLSGRGEEPGRGGSGNAVQIMTVHKSKGLEFPIVFLCDTNRQFNRADTRETVLIHPELGLGPKVTDSKRGIEYPSLARTAIKLRAEREMLSEEMRLLYVALTRAKEYLFITAAVKDPGAKLEKLAAAARSPMPPELLMSAQSPAVWLMYAALCDNGGCIKLTVQSRFGEGEGEAESSPAEEEGRLPEADDEAVEYLRRRLSFEYPFKAAQTLPSKVTATELKGLAEPDSEAVSIAPKRKSDFRSPELLLRAKPLTGAERGTATHLLLQYIDYAKAQSAEGIKNELRRLTAANFLSARQAEAVDEAAVLRLFLSPLGQRILAADTLRREFKFSLLCPAEELFGRGNGDSVLLQGVIDCCIEEDGELVVIDYKTDLVSGAALSERAKSYAPQLRAYAMALGRISGKRVKECVLYFLHAGKAVAIEEK